MSIRTLLIPLIGLSLLCAMRADAGVLVSVAASPPSIAADGKSNSQILVTVLDQSGTAVPDGVEVRLTTSAGDITPVVYTSGGRAVGILTSSTIPQIATVEALASGASGSVQVGFTAADSDRGEVASRSITITGGSLAYCVDTDTVFASGGVLIEVGGTTISAIGAQICQRSGKIRAQGKVTVRNEMESVEGDSLAWETGGSRLRVLDSTEQKTRVYNAASLEGIEGAETDGAARDMSALPSTDSKNWIISERLVIVPGRELLFFRASIYVGDTKVVKVPYYSYSYDKRQSILQQVRYTSASGVVVDFPFYYRMAPSGTGALKLRYAADGSELGGYSRPRKGLSLGLEQGYAFNDRSRGTAFIDSVGSSSMAYELAHQLEFGSAATGGYARLSARFQPSSSYAKDMYNASLNVSGSMRSYNYSLTGYVGGSSIGLSNSLTGVTDYIHQSSFSVKNTLRPKTPVANSLMGTVSPSWSLGYGSLWNSSDNRSSVGLYQSLGLSQNKMRPGPGGLSVGFSTNAALTATARGKAGFTLNLGPTLGKNWNGGSTSLSYTYSVQDGTNDCISSQARHLVGWNVFLSRSGVWTTSSFVSYGLDTGRLNLSSRFSYYISRAWRMESSYDLYRYAYDMDGYSWSYATSYLKAGIYRSLGAYEIGIAWSPDGRNYGLEKDKRLWLEFGGRGM